MNDQRLLQWLWFAEVMGVGANTLPALSLYGSPGALLAAREYEDLSPIAGRAQRSRLHALEPEQMAPRLARCRELGVRILTPDHEEYPVAFRLLENAPAVLYCTGDVSALSSTSMVGMVGSRRPSAYGRQAAQKIAGELAAAGVTIVSGMADGLDSEAHKAALEQGARTVAVMGTAPEVCYPASHAGLRRKIETQGAVLTEVPPDTRGGPRFFVLRNRLIAALSDALCVVEAREGSGTMITAGYAAKYGRPVFSVPGSIFSPLSEGTNQLLGKGAKPCTGADCILRALGIDPAPAASAPASPPKLDDVQKQVLAALGPTPKTMGQLSADTGLPAWQLAAALTALELAGLADQLAGRQYLLRGGAVL